MVHKALIDELTSIRGELLETGAISAELTVRLKTLLKAVYSLSGGGVADGQDDNSLASINAASTERIQLLLDDIIPLFFQHWLKDSTVSRQDYALYARLSKLQNTLVQDLANDLVSFDTLDEYQAAFERIQVEFQAMKLKNSLILSESPSRWCNPCSLMQVKMDTTAKTLSKTKNDLGGISRELRALHARLVEIKKELKALLKRNSPHAFSLTEVHVLQDELREIDSAKMDNKYMNREGIVISGQARVIELLESCYDDVHELLSAKDVVSGDNPLRDVYEKLIRIRAALEGHSVTYRWSLDSQSLVRLQEQLGEIDNLRVDGKFMDEKGAIPEGQAVLHFLLHKCYRLVRSLVTSMEQVADELMPQYNQLLTLKKCLGELERWNIQLSPREVVPYRMKLDAIERLASDDGHFRNAQGDAYEGEGMLRTLIKETKDQLLVLEEKDEQDGEE